MTKVTAFYNEINPEAAAWLRSLIAAGQIAPGVVDERSIEDVCPDEPGTFPLAHGLPRSLGALSPELRRLAEVAGLSRASLKGAKAYRIDGLKGYGNAINAIAAQAFIESSFEAMATINALRKAA